MVNPEKKSPRQRELLIKSWYKKLKASGFKDLEYFSGVEMTPNDWMKRPTQEVAFIQINEMNPDCPSYDETVEYFSACEDLLFSPNPVFESELHRQVWEGHTKGMTLRRIGSLVGCSHSKVNRIIVKYRDEYLIKEKTNDTKTD